jgi:GH15 family glucan-1,4-alpha-glucosidase
VPLRIEDYALIGDCETAALVGKDGSIDWLCLPRFDSGACFAALLGTPEHGRWLLAPAGEVRAVRRCYRHNTLVLETRFETDEGAVTLIDCMPVRSGPPILVRVLRGERGRVPMRMELVIRFDYGSIIPWVRRTPEGDVRAVAGPDALHLRGAVELRGKNLTTVAEFAVAEGEQVPFTLTWFPSHVKPSDDVEALEAVRQTQGWWELWTGCCPKEGPWGEVVVRSLITLKALTYAPTGGIVAAPTTSLPEQLGGVRNWDYRYCWLRDATFTLFALLEAGRMDEARAWRDWLLRAVAGNPSATQIMYGLAGERRLTELELPWLPGYQGARPVRIGNAASDQFQLDVYGEVIDAMYHARVHGLESHPVTWPLMKVLMEFLESAWSRPDEGIWEVRGPHRHFTHSKVMAWVAFDRAVKSVERLGRDGPVEHWRQVRDAIHAQVCREGFDTDLGAFVQFYGARHLDASLLMIPLVGFLPASDPRVRGTADAIQRRLMKDGFVLRYTNKEDVDGLPPGEGAFLACTFWLCDNLALMGRTDEARAIFDRLLGLCNDIGLLSEEFDPPARRLVGNFPQAFSHVGLINSAANLSRARGPAEHRQQT